jgi:hypothetical protein
MLRLSACKGDIATPHSEKRVDRRGDRVIPLKDAWSGSAKVTEQQKCVQRPKTVSALSSQSKGKTPRFCPDVGHFAHSRGGEMGFAPPLGRDLVSDSTRLTETHPEPILWYKTSIIQLFR